MNAPPGKKTLTRLCCAAFAILLPIVAAGAEEPKDYSKGFEMFYKLGLPDSRGATYVKLDWYGGDRFPDFGDTSDARLSGNAWLIEEKDGKGRFITNQCRLVEVENFDTAQKRAASSAAVEDEEAALDPFDAGNSTGKWEKADATGDAAKVIEYLRKVKEKPDENRSLDYSDGYGQLLLIAIHFHRQGLAKEANEIVGALFQLAGDPKKAIAQALDRLGDAKYDEACDRFFKARDWKVFAGDIDGLLGKFSVGWKTGFAVKRVADKVRKRPDTAPAVQGESLMEEDVALAADLASAGDYKGSTIESLWIFADTTGGEPKDAIDRITARGTKSIPLLLALLKDDYLTAIDFTKLKGRSHFYSSDEKMDEEAVTRMYYSIRRPSSCGEIAAHLLQPLIVQRGDDRFSSGETVEPAELIEEVAEWWAKNKAKTPGELARMYLADGDDRQRMFALKYLIAQGGDEDTTTIEKYLLDVAGSNSDLSAVQQYVTARGAKARAFVDKYETALKAQIARGGEMFDNDSYKQQLDRTLQYLKETTSDQSAKEFIAEIVAGKRKLADASALYRKLANETPENALSLILDAAAESRDATLSRGFIYIAPYVPTLKSRMAASRGGARQSKPERASLKIETHAGQWRKLLADNREIEDMQTESQATVADAAAWTIETLYGADSAREATLALGLLDQRVNDLFRARATTRLEGKSDLPPYPSAATVSAERKQEIAAKVGKADAGSVAAFVDSLSPAESLALVELAATDNALSEKLLPIAHRIVSAKVTLTDAKTTEKLSKLKGAQLEKKTVEELLDVVRSLTTEGKNILCTAIRQGGYRGITLRMRELSARELSDSEYAGLGTYASNLARNAKGVVFAVLSGGAVSANAFWPIDGAKAPAKGEDDEIPGSIDSASTVEAQEEFWKKVEQFSKEGRDAGKPASLGLFGLQALKDKPASGVHSRLYQPSIDE